MPVHEFSPSNRNSLHRRAVGYAAGPACGSGVIPGTVTVGFEYYPRTDLSQPPSVRYPAVPTLVLSGDLDSVTAVTDANEAAAQLPDAVHVVVPNLGHVVTDSDEIGCRLGSVHRFVKNLDPGNTLCVLKVRPVRTVPLFAVTASELAPLQALKGDKTTDAQRRIAAAGLETVGDVITRYYVTYNFVDIGLRGGIFTYAATGTGYKFKLKGLKWTDDVAVTGTVSWNQDQTSNIITAQVTLKSAGKQVGTLQIRWNDEDIDAMASVTGEIQGATLIAERIAP